MRVAHQSTTRVLLPFVELAITTLGIFQHTVDLSFPYINPIFYESGLHKFGNIDVTPTNIAWQPSVEPDQFHGLITVQCSPSLECK